VETRLEEDNALDAERHRISAAAASARAQTLIQCGIGSRSRDQRPSN
jgi:hypothetical protein